MLVGIFRVFALAFEFKREGGTVRSRPEGELENHVSKRRVLGRMGIIGHEISKEGDNIVYSSREAHVRAFDLRKVLLGK